MAIHSIPFNIAVHTITSRLLPCGFDVSAHAPSTFEQLLDHYARTGRVCVWDGASDQTIFGDPGINHMFRAWHDSKHILGRYPFTRDGEVLAMKAQQADVYAIYDGKLAEQFCNLLEAEILGQFDYAAINGGFPIDQIGFTERYLIDPDGVMMSDSYGVSNAVITRQES